MTPFESRQRIIQESLHLLNSHGYKTVTMDRIAAELRISKRTLYELFPNKEELIMACIEQVSNELKEKRLRAEEATQEPLLLTLYFIRSTAMHFFLYARFMQETKRYYPSIIKDFTIRHTARLNDGIRQMLIAAQERHDLRNDVDVDLAIKILNTFFNKCHRENDDEEGERDKMRQMSETCYIYMRGLMSVEAIQRYESKMPEFKAIVEQDFMEKDK